MHEQAIAQEIIRQASKTAKEQGKAVKGIVVEVGDLGHLPANEMGEALRTMVPDWDVQIKRKEATVACSCGFEGAPEILEKGHDHNVFRCPECHAMMPEILDGHDIVLVSVDVA